MFVRDGLIWRRHSRQLKSRIRARGQPLDCDEDDLPFPPLRPSNDDATNVPDMNAEEQYVPLLRRSIRARREPDRLNYDILGGQN